MKVHTGFHSSRQVLFKRTNKQPDPSPCIPFMLCNYLQIVHHPHPPLSTRATPSLSYFGRKSGVSRPSVPTPKNLSNPPSRHIISSKAIPRPPYTPTLPQKLPHSSTRPTLIEDCKENHACNKIQPLERLHTITPTIQNQSIFPMVKGATKRPSKLPAINSLMQKRNYVGTLATPKLSSRKTAKLPPKISKPMLANPVKTFAIRSKAGRYSDKSCKSNQDAFICIKDFMRVENLYLFGVTDGHGDYGKTIAEQITKILPPNMERIEEEYQKTNGKSMIFGGKAVRQSLLLETFDKTQADIVAENKTDSENSGSTATFVLIIGRILLCANVGDSRAILAADKGAKWTVTQISKDHKPDIQQEYMRIIKSNGCVDMYRDSEGHPLGPNRVWNKDHSAPGLAMSRSIGDSEAREVGVISTPDVLELEIAKDDKIVVIASDGVWEVFSNEKVMEIVGEFYEQGDAEAACDTLVKITAKEWRRKGNEMDDITAVVIFLTGN